MVEPGQLAAQVEDWSLTLARKAQRYQAMRVATERVRVTESARDGAVSVTVDSTGQVVDIVTTDRLRALRPEQIGPAITACLRRAQSRLADQVGAVVRETLGPDDPAVARLDRQYRDRFPEPAPQPPVPGPRMLVNPMAAQEPAPPPPPPPPPPRRATPVRSTVDDSDDWSEQGILRPADEPGGGRGV